MPSTFTPSGVELIANGEQSSVWGDTTNVNLQIIDRMTSQAGTITLSGTTHTLTLTDGVLSDGHYNVLVFAGSPSGTNTVTISPNTAQRTFFVRNTTAQSVVLSQGSGTNVTVPTNTSKIVYTNGGGAGATVFDITNTVAANVTGNAGTATALQTARTIGGVSFNGTANINLPGVNTAGNQNTTGSAATLTTARTLTIGSTGKTFNGSANVAWTLGEIGVNNSTLTLATSGIATGSQTWTSNQGTNATFTVNVPATNLSATAGTTAGPTINSSTGTNVVIPSASGTASGVVTTTAQTFAGAKTFSSTITGSVSGNAGTATALQNARTIGGVSFNGTANINLPGVNTGGNQNTTGSAATLTTARTLTIGSTGKTFNGSANVAWTLAEVGAQASNAQLTALAALATNGIIARTGTNTVAARTLTAGANITITNGNGVSGNPTISATAPAPTTAQVGAATAGLAAGAVGTYAFLGETSGTTVTTFGGTRAGSALRPAGIRAINSFNNNNPGNVQHSGQASAQSGTWRCMGVSRSVATGPEDNNFGATLWLRIS